MANILEIEGQYLMIEEMIENEEADEEVLMDTWEAIEGELNVKVENTIKICKNLDGQIKAMKDLEAEIAKKRKTLENRKSWLNGLMFSVMKRLDLKKAGGDIFSARIQKNGGKLPLIMDCSVDDLPIELVKITTEADNEAIRKYLDEGGTEFAHYGERGESLRY